MHPSLVNMPRPAAVARWMLCGTVLVPVIVVPGFFFPFTTLRAVYFRVLVELATGILLFLVLHRNVRARFRADPVFWTLLAWVATNGIAAAFGVAPLRSVFGDHERMGGVWFWIHLLVFYIALRSFLGAAEWRRFFQLALAVAVVVAAYGLLQYFFRFRLLFGGVDQGVTIGNPGLLAGYLLAAAGLAAILLAGASTRRARLVYAAIFLLLTVALAFSGNRSATLAVLFGAAAATGAYGFWSGVLRGRIGVLAAALGLALVVVPAIALMPWSRPLATSVPALGRLAGGVDRTRVVQWQAALEGVRDRPLLGVGPENYQIIWSRYNHPELHRLLGDSRFDRAHNVYLDALATSGAFGFLALLAVWVSILGRAWRNGARRSGGGSARERLADASALGLSAAYAFYLFFWFFDLNATMIFVAVAAFIASRGDGHRRLLEFGPVTEKRWQSRVVTVGGGVVLAATLYVHGFETLRMARALDRATVRMRPLPLVLRDFKSVFASPAPVTQHAFPMYANYVRALYGKFREVRSDPASAALFDSAFVLAITEFERQARQDPLNDRISTQHARLLLLGAFYYRNPRLYESALVKLRRVVDLAPRRIPPYLALGSAYVNAQRPDLALASFLEAYRVYPPLGLPRAYVASAYAALGRYDDAGAWLMHTLDTDFIPDKALVRNVAVALDRSGRTRAATELVRAYLRRRIGPRFTWSPKERPSVSDDHGFIVLAAEFYARLGDETWAGSMREGAGIVCSSQTALPLLAATWGATRRVFPACLELWRQPDS